MVVENLIQDTIKRVEAMEITHLTSDDGNNVIKIYHQTTAKNFWDNGYFMEINNIETKKYKTMGKSFRDGLRKLCKNLDITKSK
jgi:hypothetical protein